MAKRITLTKAQAASQAGAALLSLLVEVTSDGELSLGEVNQLKAWLEQNGDAADVPAIAWLRELIGDILSDGRVTQDERVDLILAIERVMPKDHRLLATGRRRAAEALTEEPEEPPEPATEPQCRYILALGGVVPDGLTKESASDLIDSLLSTGRSVSNRQMMVLRFWNRLDVREGGKRGVSEWMDAWYAEDRDRVAAWSIWKEENGDTGRQDNPEKVPIGVGEDYLRRVKSERQTLATPQAPSSPPTPQPRSGCLLLGGLILGGIWFGFRLLA